MPSRSIICTNCRHSGEIEVHGLQNNVAADKIFRHLGHNPFSGHLHYQCPACDIVLLVNPVSLLSDSQFSFSSHDVRNMESPGQAMALPRESLFQRILQH